MAAGLALASLAGSAASNILGSISGYYGAKAQKYQAETSAKLAKMQGKNTALNLSQDYNRARASDVVMAAAQNRRGGSVAGIARAAEEQYVWDVDFADFSAKLQEMGYQSQATQYGLAAKQTLLGGTIGAIGGAGLTAYSNMSAIGGSTQPATSSNYYSSIGTSGYFSKK